MPITKFNSLTKAQKLVLEVLCTMTQRTMNALDIKPSTLGVLCSKGMVNVIDGQVHATCAFLWNMTYHSDKYAGINAACMDSIEKSLMAGQRITAVKTLREYTHMELNDAITWMNHHFPR
jgi:hypothetical protein